MPKLYPILIHCRNYTLSYYINTLSLQFIQCICSTLYMLNVFLKLYHNLFTKLNHKKIYGVRQSPQETSSSPPHLCSHYTTWGENYPSAALKTSGGVKIMRQRNNYHGLAWVDQKSEKKISQCPKLSHSAENTLFHIFLH